MANYRNRTTGEVLSDRQVKLAHKNTSFSTNTFDDLGYDAVFPAPRPAPTTVYKVVHGNGVTQDANGNWVEAWAERDMTQDEIDAYDLSLIPTDDDLKLAGVEILGVMCSATRNDQNGLVAVALEYNMKHGAGQTLGDTVFKFENGNTLLITDANFLSVYSTWAPFRQSFFTP